MQSIAATSVLTLYILWKQADLGLIVTTHVKSTNEYYKPRLLDQVRDKLKLKHYSYRTEQFYIAWISVLFSLTPHGAGKKYIIASLWCASGTLCCGLLERRGSTEDAIDSRICGATHYTLPAPH